MDQTAKMILGAVLGTGIGTVIAIAFMWWLIEWNSRRDLRKRVERVKSEWYD
jgi:uncharacterized membrane protein YccC